MCIFNKGSRTKRLLLFLTGNLGTVNEVLDGMKDTDHGAINIDALQSKDSLPRPLQPTIIDNSTGTLTNIWLNYLNLERQSYSRL